MKVPYNIFNHQLYNSSAEGKTGIQDYYSSRGSKTNLAKPG